MRVWFSRTRSLAPEPRAHPNPRPPPLPIAEATLNPDAHRLPLLAKAARVSACLPQESFRVPPLTAGCALPSGPLQPPLQVCASPDAGRLQFKEGPWLLNPQGQAQYSNTSWEFSWCLLVSVSHSVLSDSLGPGGLYPGSSVHGILQARWLPFPSPMHESENAQSCPTLSDPMDCSLPGFAVHGLFQARVLEVIAIPFSRESSPTQGLKPSLPHCGQILYC